MSALELPVLTLPTKTITLPESGLTVTIRSYTVQEEKIMKMGLETGTPKAIRAAIIQVISNALVSGENFQEFPLVDIEHVFMQMYSMSRGNVINIGYRCLNKNEEGVECGAHIDHILDIRNYKYKPAVSEELKRVFKVTEDVAVEIKKPSAKMFFDGFKYVFAEKDASAYELFWDTVLDCTVSVINGDQVTVIADGVPKEKLTEFYSGVPSAIIEEIEKFLDDVSSLEQDAEIKCGGCGNVSKRVFTGVEDFFA